MKRRTVIVSLLVLVVLCGVILVDYTTSLSATATITLDGLLQRIEKLEQRVAKLEKLLDAQKTGKQSSNAMSQDKSKVIAKFQGSGIVNTKPFAVNGGWTIQWNARGDVFQIYVYTKDGQLVDVAANQMGSGKGSSYQPQGGTYYLKVNAMGNWEIAITQ